jgi:hypothetical protein
MKKIIRFLCVVTPTLILTSCATIFTGTKADIKITSNPPNSKVYSLNKEQQLTELGITPCVVTIKKKTPFLVVKSDGYYDETYDVGANSKLNPVYFLNILNLSVGMWIDLGTGAYIRTEKEVNFEMKKKAQ